MNEMNERNEKTCAELIESKYADTRDDLNSLWDMYRHSYGADKDFIQALTGADTWYGDDHALLSVYEKGFNDGNDLAVLGEIERREYVIEETDDYLKKLNRAHTPPAILARAQGYMAGMMEKDEFQDLTMEAMCNYGLAVSYVPGDLDEPEYFRWELSWGGPSDEIRFFWEGPNFNLIGIEYRYHDWFDGAGKLIDRYHEDFPFWSEIWNWFNESGTPQHLYETYDD